MTDWRALVAERRWDDVTDAWPYFNPTEQRVTGR